MSQSQSSEVGTGTTASRAELADQRGGRDDSSASAAARLRRWFLQRGVLYGLTQTPMIALMVGFIFKWIPAGNGVPRFANRVPATHVDSLPAPRLFRPR